MTDKIRREFDEIARLADHGESGRTRYDDELLSLVPQGATRILEVGSGLGRLTSRLATPGRAVVGIDFSDEMVARARATYASPQLTFVAADFLAWKGDKAFDCIISAATLHHMPMEAALTRMRESLTPGGRLIVHDLCDIKGVIAYAKFAAAMLHESLMRLMRTGKPRPSRAVRKVWAKHAADDHYATVPDIRSMSAQVLGNDVRLIEHWLGRYTMVWDKPQG